MDWIHHYQLFLFDFDGILVNTEELHYKAYIKICADRGFNLKWDKLTYLGHAMYTATGVKEGVYREFPELQRQEPSWDVLYKEKKKAYYQLLQEEGVALMPGVEALLTALEKKGIKRCVVTHSPAEQIHLIRKQHPLLDSIPYWITREHYSQPKPSSECYQKALAVHKSPGDHVIGFEDSPRGLKALLGTEAEGVFITEFFTPAEIAQLSEETGRPFMHFSSFLELFSKRGG
jgi:beta-phosphoglucomutase